MIGSLARASLPIDSAFSSCFFILSKSPSLYADVAASSSAVTCLTSPSLSAAAA